MKFHLPGFFEFFGLNMGIIQWAREYPDRVRTGLEVGSVYGTFPSCPWCGGRYHAGPNSGTDNIVSTFKAYNELGIPVRLTFSNSLVDEKWLSDRYSNHIMDIGSDAYNEVLVNNPLLEAYIRKKYPSYGVILSTTSGIRDIDLFNDKLLHGDYKCVVMDFRDNKNEAFLSKIADRSKVEILVDNSCDSSCTRVAQHFREVSMANLNNHPEQPINCPANARFPDEVLKDDTTLSYEEIDQYARAGFNHFKLEGRAKLTVDNIEMYSYYLIKPEWRSRFRVDMGRRIFGGSL